MLRLVAWIFILYIIYSLHKEGGERPSQCWKAVQQSGLLKGRTQNRLEFTRFVQLFPTILRPTRLLEKTGLGTYLDYFQCWITPLFVGALEDVLATHILDLFLPTFLVIVVFVTIEGRIKRAEQTRLENGWKNAPLVLTTMQFGELEHC